MVEFCPTWLGFKDIYTWKKIPFRLGPFLTLSVINGPIVSFGTYFLCNVEIILYFSDGYFWFGNPRMLCKTVWHTNTE